VLNDLTENEKATEICRMELNISMTEHEHCNKERDKVSLQYNDEIQHRIENDTKFYALMFTNVSTYLNKCEQLLEARDTELCKINATNAQLRKDLMLCGGIVQNDAQVPLQSNASQGSESPIISNKLKEWYETWLYFLKLY